MRKYKIIYGDEEQDEIFDSEEDAQEYALYLAGCEQLGAETLHMSNPGDYDYDEETWKHSDYNIIEVDD